jgi:hypothetical protein
MDLSDLMMSRGIAAIRSLEGATSKIVFGVTEKDHDALNQ